MRTSKKEIHALEDLGRMRDSTLRIYARFERDATGKAYTRINGELKAYKTNREAYEAAFDHIMATA